MLNNIVAAVDGSESSLRAVDFAADIAKAYDAKLTLVHVLSRMGSAQVPEELLDYADIEHVRVTEMDILRSVSSEILNRARAKASERGANVAEIISEVGDPAKHIVAQAKDRGADLIVLGTRGLGSIKELMLGSVSHKVTHLAPCPCATVH